MSQAYSDPKRESDPHALPNVEVWHAPHAVTCDDCGLVWEAAEYVDHTCEVSVYPTPGWYWQSCFPGCWPDGDPFGPFETEAEALADAQEGVEY